MSSITRFLLNLSIGAKLGIASGLGVLLVATMVIVQIRSNAAMRDLDARMAGQQTIARDAVDAKASIGGMQTAVRDLRVATYKKILGLNLSQFDKTPIGTLTTRTINDIESINDIFADGLVPIIADLLSIVCVLAFMLWTDWRLTLIALIPFPIILLGTYYFKESINKSFFRVRNAVASLNAFVQEHLTGMQVLQAFAAEDSEFEKFKKINREHRNANIKAIFAYSVFFPLVEIVLAISIGLIVWWTSRQALNLQQSQQGTVVAFILCLNLIFRPLRVIADKFNVLQMGIIASERVFKVMDNEDFIPDSREGAYAPAGELKCPCHGEGLRPLRVDL